MHSWIALFEEQIRQTTWLQWFAVIFGMAEVLLARSNNIWLYPAGIASIFISIYLLIDVQLYAESALSLYYLVMSVYGWIYWIRKKNEPPIKITYSNRKEWIIALSIVFLGWLILFVLLKKFTPSNVPVWDAWVSSTAWAGMWLLARRKIENWIFLNVSNLFAIPLLLYKGLPLLAILTLFLFVVAFFGFFEWRSILKKRKPGSLGHPIISA